MVPLQGVNTCKHESIDIDKKFQTREGGHGENREKKILGEYAVMCIKYLVQYNGYFSIDIGK